MTIHTKHTPGYLHALRSCVAKYCVLQIWMKSMTAKQQGCAIKQRFSSPDRFTRDRVRPSPLMWSHRTLSMASSRRFRTRRVSFAVLYTLFSALKQMWISSTNDFKRKPRRGFKAVQVAMLVFICDVQFFPSQSAEMPSASIYSERWVSFWIRGIVHARYCRDSLLTV